MNYFITFKGFLLKVICKNKSFVLKKVIRTSLLKEIRVFIYFKNLSKIILIKVY